MAVHETGRCVIYHSLPPVRPCIPAEANHKHVDRVLVVMSAAKRRGPKRRGGERVGRPSGLHHLAPAVEVDAVAAVQQVGQHGRGHVAACLNQWNSPQKAEETGVFPFEQKNIRKCLTVNNIRAYIGIALSREFPRLIFKPRGPQSSSFSWLGSNFFQGCLSLILSHKAGHSSFDIGKRNLVTLFVLRLAHGSVVSMYTLEPKYNPFLMKSSTMLLVATLAVFACTQDNQKNIRADLSSAFNGGYNYAVVHSEDRKTAQFSTVFYSECDDRVLMQRAKAYAQKHNFSDYRIGMSKNVATQAEAEKSKEADKRESRNSGYVIGGDNNYIGDCNK